MSWVRNTFLFILSRLYVNIVVKTYSHECTSSTNAARSVSKRKSYNSDLVYFTLNLKMGKEDKIFHQVLIFLRVCPLSCVIFLCMLPSASTFLSHYLYRSYRMRLIIQHWGHFRDIWETHTQKKKTSKTLETELRKTSVSVFIQKTL